MTINSFLMLTFLLIVVKGVVSISNQVRGQNTLHQQMLEHKPSTSGLIISLNHVTSCSLVLSDCTPDREWLSFAYEHSWGSDIPRYSLSYRRPLDLTCSVVTVNHRVCVINCQPWSTHWLPVPHWKKASRAEYPWFGLPATTKPRLYCMVCFIIL